ncbi:polypyrimidine tract-binding protein homolog 2 isoform X1 [Musa acuminata AAA Group]|uniref:polypyrimidine tract-binding protein homolog 2 isoform X1 n=1 Tax=Musa acuminata AAA Group TaxID=214697 RepID=UPI0031E24DE6
MSSISGQPQFRYTQPPSKVIHLRNLPWECTDEELIELGKPFGTIVKTKCNVGANRNQAFIEFADLNQAIAMISYYASSAEPAQIRGKTVYLQYSNRQEIVNNKVTADAASNVLLVTVEGVEAGDVSIDVLHLVFSAFGFVHKIATFEKTAGFQALVQFSDSDIASSAKNALDGRSIPRYLLQEHVGPCTLKINFSAHTDLNVKFQSHRSRDYTNPYLPVAPSAIDIAGQDGMKQEPESNVLLASIENMQYTVTIDVLHEVFSAFGFVQKIALFEKNAGFQALIQYPDIQTANIAKQALEGHCIYEGGFCKLHLTYSRHTDLNVKINNDRGRDYTGGNIATVSNQPSLLGPQPVPMPGATVHSYNSIPYPAISNGVSLPQVPQAAASWDIRSGAMAPLQLHNQSLPPQLHNQPLPPHLHNQPLHPHLHNQIHIQHVAPPGVAPHMMPLPGQRRQQLLFRPPQPYGH